MNAFNDSTILDPATFAFFKGIDGAAVGGQLTANVTAGLPAGNYRLASINTDANHAPAIVAVAQHGWLDDIVYVRLLLSVPDFLNSYCSPSSSPHSKVGTIIILTAQCARGSSCMRPPLFCSPCAEYFPLFFHLRL
jgi:hypothetical protein